MIRKVYWDFIKAKLAGRDMGWLTKRLQQYFLIHLSYLLKRPLAGPLLGTLMANYTCNYRCKMCNLPAQAATLRKKGLKELSTAQLKQLLRELASLGTAGVGFTGGEPLLRSDLFELLSLTKELGMFAHLSTNAYFLNQQNLKKLIAAKTDSLNISLDGARAKTHDAIRGFSGAFDKAIAAIEQAMALRKTTNAPLRLKVVAVINEQNIEEIPDLIKLKEDLKIDCIEFIPKQPFSEQAILSAARYDDKFFQKLDKATAYLKACKSKGVGIENSFRHLALFESSFKGQKSPLTCYAGYNSYAVDCYGQIFPCMPWINWGNSVGNIKEISLKDFWSSTKYNKKRKDIARCRDCYLNCQAELNLTFNIF